MAKDKQKDLFITKAKHLNTCELKTLDKKKFKQKNMVCKDSSAR
jgi:hypothetical protein